MNARPVVFRNDQGLKLHGILHEPEQQTGSLGVILLSPGIKMRVAPHRLYLAMAEVLVAMGVPVLRFDFSGLGDSEGEIEDDSLMSVYNSIQSGRFVGDTRAAMNWMQSECGVTRFVLSGLCGGAITGLLAAAEDKRVDGLMGLGIPVAFDGGREDFAKYVTQGQLERMRRMYVRKLLSPSAWLRLLSFRSDYRIIGKVLRQWFARLRGGKVQQAVEPPSEALANVNPKFAPAFFSMVKRGGRMLLVFSGADRLGWEFEEKFVAPNRAALEPYRDRFQVRTVEDANHVFTLREWQDEMLIHLRAWFQRNYSAADSRVVEDMTVGAEAACQPALRDG